MPQVACLRTFKFANDHAIRGRTRPPINVQPGGSNLPVTPAPALLGVWCPSVLTYPWSAPVPTNHVVVPAAPEPRSTHPHASRAGAKWATAACVSVP